MAADDSVILPLVASYLQEERCRLYLPVSLQAWRTRRTMSSGYEIPPYCNKQTIDKHVGHTIEDNNMVRDIYWHKKYGRIFSEPQLDAVD